MAEKLVTSWRYHLPNDKSGEGWAIVFLDSIGCFAAISDWGNYAHRWPEAGWEPSRNGFREFILGCGDDYVLRKLAPRDTYLGNRTERAIKTRILEGRRSGGSREDARREWDLLREHELDTREGFALWYQETKIDCAYDLAVYDVHPQARAFMARVMPRLRDRIREELAKEAEHV